ARPAPASAGASQPRRCSTQPGRTPLPRHHLYRSAVVGSPSLRRASLRGVVLGALVVAAFAVPAVAFAKPGDLIVAENGGSMPRIVRINPANGHESTIAAGHGLASPARLTLTPGGKLFAPDSGANGCH